VDSKEEALSSGKHEAVVDLEKMELNLNVVRNETLINLRKAQANLDLKMNSIADNVIVIYIDTLGRV
jgi:hypothetical protein